MDTIFMNSENSRTSDPYRLLYYRLLNHSDKVNLKRSDKHYALSNLRIYYTRESVKSYIKVINLKYQLGHGIESLIYLMHHIMYQIFKITSKIS